MDYNNYYVYILSNTTGSVLYVGMTNDIERRVYEHKQHLIPGFTEKYNVTRLVFLEKFNDVEEAIEKEKLIKGWRRSKKIKLIEENNPHWDELAD